MADVAIHTGHAAGRTFVRLRVRMQDAGRAASALALPAEPLLPSAEPGPALAVPPPPLLIANTPAVAAAPASSTPPRISGSFDLRLPDPASSSVGTWTLPVQASITRSNWRAISSASPNRKSAMKAVDILRNKVERLEVSGHLSDCIVAGIRLDLVDYLPAVLIPLPDDLRVGLESLERGQLLGPELLPEPVGAAECGHARFGRDAGAG